MSYLLSANYSLYIQRVDGSSYSPLKLNKVDHGSNLTIICAGGRTPEPATYQPVDYQCTNGMITPSVPFKCQWNEVIHPRFSLLVGKSLLPYGAELGDKVHVAIHLHRLYYKIKENGVSFPPKGYFSVGNNFTWFSYVRVSLLPSSERSIISWLSPSK